MNKFKLVRRGQKFAVRVRESDEIDGDFPLEEILDWLKSCNIKHKVKHLNLVDPDDSASTRWTSCWFYAGNNAWDSDFHFETKSDAIAFMIRWVQPVIKLAWHDGVYSAEGWYGYVNDYIMTPKIRNWCNDNLSGNWDLVDYTIFIECEKDAAWFTLMWGQ